MIETAVEKPSTRQFVEFSPIRLTHAGVARVPDEIDICVLPPMLAPAELDVISSVAAVEMALIHFIWLATGACRGIVNAVAAVTKDMP